MKHAKVAGYFILLIIPALLMLIVIWLREGWGAYYFTNNADPAYLYLINSLNVATLFPVQHVDNPGTTVQLLGGAVIRVIALFQGISDIEADVFSRPEYYLVAINRVLFSINLLGIVILGLFTYRMTANIWAALLLQCAPFASYLLIKSMLMVSPEPMSVFSTILLIMLIVWASAGQSHITRPALFATLSAIVLAFGLATKITYIPFILIPLIILESNKWRAVYLLLTIFIFHIFLIPAYAHYDFFLHWIKILILHTENYGQGATGVVNMGSFAVNLIKIFVLEHTFFFILIFSVLLLVLIFTHNSLRELRGNRQVRILFAVTMAIAVHTLLVAKHYNPRYMIPALMLMTTIIYLDIRIYRMAGKSYGFEFLRHVSFKVGAAIVLTILFLVRHIMGYMPGDTVVVWRETISKRSTIADWLLSTPFENCLLFAFVILLVFSVIIIAYRKRIELQKLTMMLSGSLLIMGILYHLRHIDIGGFNYRCTGEKKEALAIIDAVENKYRDYIKIYGGRSSSQLYALKFGTSNNFTRTSQLVRLNELYPDKKIYFWRLKWGDQTFDNWTGKVTLQDILRQDNNVIIQGDRSSLNPESVKEMELEHNIRLEPVYEGKTEVIYRIVKS